jgi:hypothetical protein
MAKASKSEAKYQHYPHQHRRCSQCIHFLPPSSCEKVRGDISKHGYCIWFKASDKSTEWYGKAK